jgi:hypothetical protein
MPKLTFEKREQLLEQFSSEIDALNDTTSTTMTFYELELALEQTGKRLLSKTLEALSSAPDMGISPPMPALSQAGSKKRS